MKEEEGYCENLVSPSGPDEYNALSAILGFIQLLTMLLIIFWLWHQKRMAQKGDENASKLLILPAYFWFLYACAFTFTFQGLANIFVPISASGANDPVPSVIFGLTFGLNHAVLEGIAFFLMSQSAGYAAFKRAAMFGGIIGVGTFFLETGVFFDVSEKRSFIVDIIWDGTLYCFYIIILVAPLSIIYRRPALKTYSIFWVIFRTLLITIKILIYLNYDIGYCLYYFVAWTLFGLMKPIIIYNTLLKDSRYWQGLYTSDPEILWIKALRHQLIKLFTCKCCIPTSLEPLSINRQSFDEEKSPLVGNKFEKNSALFLIETIEKFSREGVQLLNFGFLSIKEESKITNFGSPILNGTYEKKDVIIKSLDCIELTKEKILGFCEEAKLLSTLRHPNIIEIYGICIVPPRLCIIMEPCTQSLDQFLRNQDELSQLNIYQKMGMMLDMAKSISFLHSQVEPIVHGSIQSQAFLLTETLAVKLTNLDFGTDSTRPYSTSILSSFSSRSKVRDYPEPTNIHYESDTLFWSAPEVMLGEEPTQSSDCYSLALVFWEVLTGQLPYATDEDESRYSRSLVDIVCKQFYRPPIPYNTPAYIADLFVDMWSPQPERRPTIQRVVQRLETMIDQAVQESAKKEKK